MNRILIATIALLIFPVGAIADSPPLQIGLRDAVRMALAQSTDVRLADLAVGRAASDLRLVRSERQPRMYGSSGLGATSGIPQSVLGTVPSVAQLTVRQPLFDLARPQRRAGARFRLEADQHGATAARLDAAYRAGALYLDFELATRSLDRLRQDADSFRRLEDLTQLRVGEGFDTPLALSKARLATARASARVVDAMEMGGLLEEELRWRLGVDVGTRLSPRIEDMDRDLGVPPSLAGYDPPTAEHPEILTLDAQLRVAHQDVAAAKSSRYPSLDLVGQYSMLARFNNFEDFYRRFERHNWQAGVAVRLPIFAGRDTAERIAQAEISHRELAIQRESRLAALALERRRALVELGAAQRATELAREAYDVARLSVDALMAQFDEGVASLADVELARLEESEAWSEMMEARYHLAKVRLLLGRASGSILTAFSQ